jgi:hypothetical protein
MVLGLLHSFRTNGLEALLLASLVAMIGVVRRYDNLWSCLNRFV